MRKIKYSNVICFETGKPFQKGYEPLPEIWIGIPQEWQKAHREYMRNFKIKVVRNYKDKK